MSETNIHKSKENRVRYGPEMKLLIVGGGVAGLTLAGLLQQRGFNPTVVERAPSYGNVGYVIVLWPTGSRVLKGLGLYRELLDRGLVFDTYNVANQQGDILHSYSIEAVTEKYGPIVSTYRTDLIDVLREAVDPESIRMGTTVDDIHDTPRGVDVTFSDGTRERYDLVIGCDGIRSNTRKMVFGDVPLTYSGLRGWSFWIKSNINKSAQIAEYWGTGKFFGVWPTKGRYSVFTSIRTDEHYPDPVDTRIERIKEQFSTFGGMVPEILDHLDRPEEIYFDEYHDLRMDKWYKNRVVLVGDAAHAILPTAGGGVSMAIESAAVLAEELCRADSESYEDAFKQYMTRRQARVKKVQDQSRMMGKIAYANSKTLSSIRDFIVRFYTNRLLLKYWDGMLKETM